MLQAVFESRTLPPHEKTPTRIYHETGVVIGAGTETTGIALETLFYHVLANPTVHRTLKAELKNAAASSGTSPSDLLTCKTVEPLPYLQACIKEALRLGSPVVGRLPRRNPHDPITYTTPAGKTYHLPPGTSVSISIPDMHNNADIFPEPRAFIPDRWLESSPSQLARMEKAWFPFGRGARQCVGLELAKQELVLVVANLFRRFELELCETAERDVSLAYDFFSPFGPEDSKGCWVMAT